MECAIELVILLLVAVKNSAEVGNRGRGEDGVGSGLSTWIHSETTATAEVKSIANK